MAAGFKYTPSGGSLTTHTLAVPLVFRQGAARRVKTRYVNIALDERTIDTVTIEGGADEVQADVRADANPSSLLDLLEHAADGGQIDYYPDLSAGTFYPLRLMNAGTIVDILMDPQRFMYGDWQRTLVLRRVDGNSLDGLIA